MIHENTHSSYVVHPEPESANARGMLVDVGSFRVFRPSRPGDVLEITARIASGRLTFHLPA